MPSQSINQTFLTKAIRQGGGRIALLIGNGIHRYNAKATGNDWNAMIQSLARQHGLKGAANATSLAMTELFDLIDLKLPPNSKSYSLQAQFCDGMSDWKPADHHHWIVNWAVDNRSPILTTNFDHVLADTVGAKLLSAFERRGNLKGPTDYYPWEKYFGHQILAHPCADFGVWHVNGLMMHKRSIKLGLTDYMGSVARARPWLHGDRETRLFSAKDLHEWRGRNTWLHIVFNMPLLIFGLGLGAEEVFLRWLLIERAKYFRLFPQRAKPAWYAHVASDKKSEDVAKHFFLDSIGIKPIALENYDAIYGQSVWCTG